MQGAMQGSQAGSGMECLGKGLGVRVEKIGLALPMVVMGRRRVFVCSGLGTSELRGQGWGCVRGNGGVRVRAATGESGAMKWWERDGGANFHDVHSTQEFVDALANAGDKLVVVEFYATWCGSCRAMYPKLCRLAAAHPDVEFFKVNFEENKPLCKSLNVKVLPYFHLYRGAEGRVDEFSCSLSKLPKLKDAIALHNTARCSIGPPVGAGNFFLSSSGKDQAAATTSASSSSSSL